MTGALTDNYARYPVEFVRGEGVRLWDADGHEYLDFLTDVRGWLRDPDDPDSVISATTADEVQSALATLSGGMRPKLQACVDAIHGGVGAAHIIDGREPHSLLLELFTNAGIGTKVQPAR